jgi:potassium-transporting ATPase potassium-binding subunit
VVFLAALLGLIPLLGGYMSKIFQGEKTLVHRFLYPLEKMTYRIAGINPQEEMTWKKYAKKMLTFNLIGFLALFLIQMGQSYLPLNPEGMGGVPWPSALNTAISFTTNTDWQAYPGETTLSYGTQMWGLTVQNFLSAATGNAVLLALIRGIGRQSGETVGNFWEDLVRTVVYVLLPLAVILSLVLVSQGVIQTFTHSVKAFTLESEWQTIPLGPVASQVAIKQIGTNGGGFFGVNSAHPFENPNGVTNFLESLSIVLLPACLTFMYGRMLKDKRLGWSLLLAMGLLWVGSLVVGVLSEQVINPLFEIQPLLEGKELRFGVFQTLNWSTLTTATANGSVNGMLDSLSPLAGGIALFNMMLGELVFGGVGVGLCSMLMFVLLTVFLAGLMVGRTPEYLGKKIEKQEIRWVSLAILFPAAIILVGSAVASAYPQIVQLLGNRGPHGFSEILYAFTSCTGNNGSAFAGLNAESHFFIFGLSFCMLLGRLAILIPSLAIAGNLVKKKGLRQAEEVLSTSSLLFIFLLIGVILVVGALTFFPALCLGPIVEQMVMLKGQAF